MIFVLVVALIGASVAVYFTTTHRDNVSYTGSANDALTRGLTTSRGVDGTGHRVGVAAELINLSPLTLKVQGPIGISDTNADAGVQVLYALLTKEPPVLAGVPTNAPPELTTILPGENVSAVVGLKIDCTRWAERSAWPSSQTTVTIELDGFDTPASYAFSNLFDAADLADRIGEMCSSE